MASIFFGNNSSSLAFSQASRLSCSWYQRTLTWNPPIYCVCVSDNLVIRRFTCCITAVSGLACLNCYTLNNPNLLHQRANIPGGFQHYNGIVPRIISSRDMLQGTILNRFTQRQGSRKRRLHALKPGSSVAQRAPAIHAKYLSVIYSASRIRNSTVLAIPSGYPGASVRCAPVWWPARLGPGLLRP